MKRKPPEPPGGPPLWCGGSAKCLTDPPCAVHAPTGEQLRDEGIERAGSGVPVAELVSWQQRARDAVERLCLSDKPFCADDVRERAGEPPVPNCMGAAFRSAYTAGLIEPHSFGQATRPPRHAAVLRWWHRAEPQP